MHSDFLHRQNQQKPGKPLNIPEGIQISHMRSLDVIAVFFLFVCFFKQFVDVNSNKPY